MAPRRRLTVLLASLTCTTLFGCGPDATRSVPTTAGELDQAVGRIAELDHGYALLLGLLKNEARVSDVLILKSASAPVEAVLRRISAAAKQQRSDLEGLLGGVPALSPSSDGLPAIETDARGRIEETQTSVLLLANGKEFELRILLTQDKAAGYASALATSLANRDPNRKRRDLCTAIARDWDGLGADVRSQLAPASSGENSRERPRKNTTFIPGTPSP